MTILHLSLGPPPFRSGGLTLYCDSLIRAQQANGHRAVLLCPGKVKLRSGGINIVSEKYLGYPVYSIVNPAYVAIPYGVRKPEWCMEQADETVYANFLVKLQPDIIHVHTFMGFHQELFLCAKKLRIPMLYTTHDFYAICPKTILFSDKDEICQGASPERCAACNRNAGPGKTLFRFLQSDFYKSIKNLPVTCLLRGQTKKRLSALRKGAPADESPNAGPDAESFRRLNEYYAKTVRLMDFIHFNSELTRELYRPLTDGMRGNTVPITVEGIEDRRLDTMQKSQGSGPLRVGFIGSAAGFKGASLLLTAVKRIREQYGNVAELHLFGDDFTQLLKQHGTVGAVCHGRFKRNELAGVYGRIDLLVIPSRCYETFGLVAAESLSFGLPLLMSKTVGAKMLLKDCPFPFEFVPEIDGLFRLLGYYVSNREQLRSYQSWILSQPFIFSMTEHERIMEGCYRQARSSEYRSERLQNGIL